MLRVSIWPGCHLQMTLTRLRFYTKEEYFSSKTGWGHSFFEHAIDSALKANVKKIVLFHHDPLRTDQDLFKLEKNCHKHFGNQSDLEIVVAKEGMEIAI